MPLFSSIASDLQLKIAEKLHYSDIKELALSSKHGKEIGKFAKMRTIIELGEIAYPNKTFKFKISILQKQTDKLIRERKADQTKRERNSSLFQHWISDTKWKSLDQLQKTFTEFPRLVVARVNISNFFSLHSVFELEKTFKSINNKMNLYWENKSTKENFLISTTGPQIANIAMLFIHDGSLKEAYKRLSEFGEIEEMDIVINNIPDATLLLYKSIFLKFRDSTSRSRIDITANHYFQQWFHNRKYIGCLMIQTSKPANSRQTNSERKETLFFGLPISMLDLDLSKSIDQRISRQPLEKPGSLLKTPVKHFIWNIKRPLRSHDDQSNNERLCNGTDVVFSIDRGDKKLLVLVSNQCIIAQEYTEQKEVIKEIHKTIIGEKYSTFYAPSSLICDKPLSR